jgi:hypothetical protein
MNWDQLKFTIIFAISVLLFAAFIRFGPGKKDFTSRKKKDIK